MAALRIGILLIVTFLCILHTSSGKRSREMGLFHQMSQPEDFVTNQQIGVQFLRNRRKLTVGHSMLELMINIKIPIIQESDITKERHWERLNDGKLWETILNTPGGASASADMKNDFFEYYRSSVTEINLVVNRLNKLFDYARETNDTLTVAINEFKKPIRQRRNIIGNFISAITGLVTEDDLDQIYTMIRKLQSSSRLDQTTILSVQDKVKQFAMIAKSNFNKTRGQFRVVSNVLEGLNDHVENLHKASTVNSKFMYATRELQKKQMSSILKLIATTTMIEYQLTFIESLFQLQSGKMSTSLLNPKDLKIKLEEITEDLAKQKPPRRLLFQKLYLYFSNSLVTSVVIKDSLFCILSLPCTVEASLYDVYEIQPYNVPLDISDPIGYQMTRNLPDHFLVNIKANSFIEISSAELNSCYHSSLIITCPHAFSRRDNQIGHTCSSAAFYNKSDLLLDLCQIDIFPNSVLSPRSIPIGDNTYIILTNTNSYNLICKNTVKKVACNALFKIKLDCECTVSYSDLLLYDTGRRCYKNSKVYQIDVDSDMFIVHQALSKLQLRLPNKKIQMFHGSTTKSVIDKSISQLRDLNTQQLNEGLSLQRLITCIEQNSQKYFESSSLEFLVDIPHIRSSSFLLVFVIINTLILIFCMIVSIYVVRKYELLSILFALCAKPGVVEAGLFPDMITTTPAPPFENIIVHLPTFTQALQYILFIVAFFMTLYKIYQFSHIFRANLCCKYLFSDSAKGSEIYLRALCKNTTVQIYGGRVPFNLDQSIITILPIPIPITMKLRTDNRLCACFYTFEIEWRNSLHYRLGLERGSYRIPNSFTISRDKATKLRKIIQSIKTNVLTIHFLIRSPETSEFKQLAIFPELVAHLGHVQYQLTRGYMPPDSREQSSRPKFSNPSPGNLFQNPHITTMPSTPSMDAGLDEDFQLYLRSLHPSFAHDIAEDGRSLLESRLDTDDVSDDVESGLAGKPISPKPLGKSTRYLDVTTQSSPIYPRVPDNTPSSGGQSVYFKQESGQTPARLEFRDAPNLSTHLESPASLADPNMSIISIQDTPQPLSFSGFGLPQSRHVDTIYLGTETDNWSLNDEGHGAHT